MVILINDNLFSYCLYAIKGGPGQSTNPWTLETGFRARDCRNFLFQELSYCAALIVLSLSFWAGVCGYLVIMATLYRTFAVLVLFLGKSMHCVYAFPEQIEYYKVYNPSDITRANFPCWIKLVQLNSNAGIWFGWWKLSIIIRKRMTNTFIIFYLLLFLKRFNITWNKTLRMRLPFSLTIEWNLVSLALM